jgi:hypothetical protein
MFHLSHFNVPGKAYLRAGLDRLERVYDTYQLSRCVKALRSGAQSRDEILHTARSAWGNEGWSADIAYLAETAERVQRCAGPILECGSGLTTILAGAIAEHRGVSLFSLEQDAQWFSIIQRALARTRVRVAVFHAPLRHYGDFVWYDLKGIELPRRFDLVLCDGPAVYEPWSPGIQAQWRVGLLPVLNAAGTSVREVLCDDMEEPRAALLLDRWRNEFGCDHEIIATKYGRCAVVYPGRNA